MLTEAYNRLLDAIQNPDAPRYKNICIQQARQVLSASRDMCRGSLDCLNGVESLTDHHVTIHPSWELSPSSPSPSLLPISRDLTEPSLPNSPLGVCDIFCLLTLALCDDDASRKCSGKVGPFFGDYHCCIIRTCLPGEMIISIIPQRVPYLARIVARIARRKNYDAPTGVWKNPYGFVSTIYVDKRRVYGPLRKTVEAASRDREALLNVEYSITSVEGMKAFVRDMLKPNMHGGVTVYLGDSSVVTSCHADSSSQQRSRTSKHASASRRGEVG